VKFLGADVTDGPPCRVSVSKSLLCGMVGFGVFRDTGLITVVDSDLLRHVSCRFAGC